MKKTTLLLGSLLLSASFSNAIASDLEQLVKEEVDRRLCGATSSTWDVGGENIVARALLRYNLSSTPMTVYPTDSLVLASKNMDRIECQSTGLTCVLYMNKPVVGDYEVFVERLNDMDRNIEGGHSLHKGKYTDRFEFGMWDSVRVAHGVDGFARPTSQQTQGHYNSMHSWYGWNYAVRITVIKVNNPN